MIRNELVFGDALTEVAESVLPVTRMTSSPEIELVRSSAGYHVNDSNFEPFWVRIRLISGPVAWAYGGYRLDVDESWAITDERDQTFTEKFPLIEMTENEEVPNDAVVWAEPHPSGNFYTFVWTGNADESGSGGADCSDLPGVSIADFLVCTDDGASIRDGRLVICNGRLTFIPE